MSEAVIETVNPDATALPDAETAGVDAQPGSSAQDVIDADPVKAAQEKPVEEDPEIEFDKDFRLKKSEARDTLKRLKELRRGAFEKFQAAAEINKRHEALLSGDPEEYFKARGIDPMQFAVERLQREVALKEATPEDRRIMELEAEKRGFLAEREQREQREQEQASQVEQQKFAAQLDKELPVAVQKHGLPTNPLVFRAVASVMAEQIRNDMPVDAEAAAEFVADSYRATFKQHAATLKYEDAVKQYPEFVKLVREGDLARARGGAAPGRPAPIPKAAPSKPAEPSSKKFAEYFDNDWAAMGVVTRPR